MIAQSAARRRRANISPQLTQSLFGFGVRGRHEDRGGNGTEASPQVEGEEEDLHGVALEDLDGVGCGGLDGGRE